MPPQTFTIIIGVTLKVALVAIAVAGPVSVSLGYLFARREFFGKSVVETIVSLPLVLPPTAIGYLLLQVLGRDGVLGPRMIGIDLDLLFTWKAAVLASALMALPLMTRAARAAFEAVDPRLETMALSLGHSRLRSFLTVTLPLAKRGIAAALILGFGRALGEFGATVIVAGNIPGKTQTLSLAIFEGIQLDDGRRTYVLVAVTIALAFALLWTVERLLRDDRRRVA